MSILSFLKFWKKKYESPRTKLRRILVPETSNYPLRIPLFSGNLIIILCLLQIWCQNLSTAFRSKVMIHWSLKLGNFKADIIVVIWSEKILDKNTKDCWRFFSHIKNMIFHPKTSKIPNLQKWYQNGSKPII